MNPWSNPRFQIPDEPHDSQPLELPPGISPTRLTWQVIFAARKYTFPAAGLIMVYQIGETLVPVIMGLAIDRALATGDVAQLALWVVVLGVNFLIFSNAYRFGSRMGFFGMLGFQHRLRMMLTDRLMHPRGSKGEASLPGISLSISTSDVWTLAASMQIGVYSVAQVFGVAFCAVMLLSISWQLGLAVIIGAPLLLAITALAGGPLRRRSQMQAALAAEAVGTAADVVSGYRVLKGVRAEQEAASRYAQVSQRALTGTLRSANAEGAYVAVMQLLAGIFIAGLAVGAGVQAVNGVLSVGELIAIVGLTQFLITPLRNFATSIGAIWAVSVASAARVLSIQQLPFVLEADQAAGDAALIGDSPTQLVYRDDSNPDGLTLLVLPGEYVGVVASAERAQSVVELLARRTEVEREQLLLRGVDARDLAHEFFREQVLVAPHEAALFDGTIEENVQLRPMTAEFLARAYAAAGCEEIFEALPYGSQTQVGEGGTRLSGGQRQRVALARALAADAPVLVLHDPTTAVDSVTETSISAAMRNMRVGRTTIIVSSSPILLADCDRVIDLDTAELAR